MCFDCGARFHIKVLQTLTWADTFFYRHLGPKGPKAGIVMMVLAGDRPPRYGCRGRGLSALALNLIFKPTATRRDKS